MKTSDILIIFVDGTTASREVRSIALGVGVGDLAVTLADGSAEMFVDVRHWFANYIEQGAEDRRNATFAHDCPTCATVRVERGLSKAARELADRCDTSELADGSSPDTLAVRVALGDIPAAAGCI